MLLRHRPLSSLLLALSAVFAAATVQAQDFPSKAVKVAVGSAAGGPVDTAARLISERLSEVWKQPVTVENRVGASEMIATDFVLKSPPDGYTLLVASLNVVTNNPVVFAKVPYDADRGWAPVAHLALNPMVLVAGQKAPFGTLKELIEQAKKAPGKITYSTPGLATTNHIAGEWFASAAGIQLFHVPYKGGPAAANAVLSGDVPLAVVSLIQALPFVKSGQFKALGITTKDRTLLAPDLPTVVEQGVPGFDAAVRVAMFAPAGTPAAIINKINGDVTRALANPQTREKFAGMGVEASGSTPAELERMVRDVRAQIQRVVDTAKIKIEQ